MPGLVPLCPAEGAGGAKMASHLIGCDQGPQNNMESDSEVQLVER